MGRLIAVILLVFITACSPSRPASVPEDAFWVDGINNKVWVKLNSVEQNKFSATIYRENGEKWGSGLFEFYANKEQYQPKGVDAAYIEKYMTDFDGETIALYDAVSGRYLTYIFTTPQ